MSRARKLLYFVTEDWYFVSHRLPLALAAKRMGYDVGVITRVREHGDLITSTGLRLIPFENARTSINPVADLWTLLRLILLYRRERPDVVHHVAMKPVIYGSIAAGLSRTPCVVNALAGMGWLFTSDSGLARWLKPVVRWGLGRILRRGTPLVQNPDDARLLVQLGVAKTSVRRIAGSGVDLDRFSPQPEPSCIPLVLLPARLLWAKGVGDFVDAARLIRAKGIPARFALVGEPDHMTRGAVPSERIEQWVREEAVEHLGWVTDMPRLLASCHIVCLPSFYGEGIPKSLIEAAAAGRPIITTDTPGCREIVHDGDNGILTPARDVSALASAMERLLQDTDLRRRMGMRSRQLAEKGFGLDAVIEQTLLLYSEART